MPYTGAFLYALCPRCRNPVVIAHAAPAPPRADAQAGPRFPSAADTDRPPAKPLAPASPYPLPPGALLETELPPPPPAAHIVQRLARGATVLGTAVVTFLLFGNLLTLVFSAPAVVQFASTHPETRVPFFVAFPFPIVIGSLDGAWAGAWHLVLAAAILGSVGVVLRRHLKDGTDKVFGVLQGQPAPALSESNGLFVIARLFCVTVLVAELVAIIATLAGDPPQIPQGLADASDLSLFIGLAHASVWEELVTRVLLLGLPLLLVHVAGRGRPEQSPLRYLLGSGHTLDGTALAFLLFSSAVFGIAHLPAWNLWKLPSAAVSGIAMGYLFLRYGLVASITFHFLTDYLLASTYLFADARGYLGILEVCLYVLMVVGVAQAGRYLFVLMEVVRARAVPPYLGGPPPRAESSIGSVGGAAPAGEVAPLRPGPDP